MRAVQVYGKLAILHACIRLGFVLRCCWTTENTYPDDWRRRRQRRIRWIPLILLYYFNVRVFVWVRRKACVCDVCRIVACQCIQIITIQKRFNFVCFIQMLNFVMLVSCKKFDFIFFFFVKLQARHWGRQAGRASTEANIPICQQMAHSLSITRSNFYSQHLIFFVFYFYCFFFVDHIQV